MVLCPKCLEIQTNKLRAEKDRLWSLINEAEGILCYGTDPSDTVTSVSFQRWLKRKLDLREEQSDDD
jgi:hypothetical protein